MAVEGEAVSGIRPIRALILQHEDAAPPGLLADWLGAQGADIDVLRIDLEKVTPDPRGYDLVASLGSEFAAFDDSKAFIRREADLLGRTVEAGVPVLGLCFGGQLLARVLGGRSFRAQHSEIGWHRVRSAAPELVPEGPWFQWHFDTFALAPDATLLASSDIGPQAYVRGRCMGLQFHPEVTPEIVAGWIRSFPKELGDGVNPDSLLEETVRLAPQVRRRAEGLFGKFLVDVAGLGPVRGSETHT